MNSTANELLVEVGTEELPPKSLLQLSEAFGKYMLAGLQGAKLVAADATPEIFASPRRLAFKLSNVARQQADQAVERRGPAVAAAFSKNGQATKAANGFAKSCGVEVDQLERMQSDKGEWLVFRSHVSGRPAAQLIPDIVSEALRKLPIPKRMRWADLDAEFVRPVHWLVALHGDTVIDMTALSVSSGRHTQGHRFHHPTSLALATTADYPLALESSAYVIADYSKRRDIIRQQVETLATEHGGTAVIDAALLDEVTSLVEWPVAMKGKFDSSYLDVPAEALISAMQDHQKYFPVIDSQGNMLPVFIFVSNIVSRQPASVSSGNERVLNARFADARFFWDTDRKVLLDERVEALKKVVFHNRLGSVYERTLRVRNLASQVAAFLHCEQEKATRAATLAKADLLSGMVGEFPDLQGIMGRYYALEQREDREVAEAIREQYLPRYAGDELPATTTGQALSIADKLDTLVGIFSIGETPTGDKDPFALRRTAVGILRIMIEQELDLDLRELLRLAAGGYDLNEVKNEEIADAVFDFMLERLQAYYLEQGYSNQQISSVQQRRPSRPLDFNARLSAVRNFSQLPEAESLAAANKRIRNILRKTAQGDHENVNPELFAEDAERSLHKKMTELSKQVDPLFTDGDYTTALTLLASLRPVVDNFFDQVMVMDENPALRQNRLALLNSLAALFLRTADLSQLQ